MHYNKLYKTVQFFNFMLRVWTYEIDNNLIFRIIYYNFLTKTSTNRNCQVNIVQIFINMAGRYQQKL
jgi:hypothetical protein